MKLSRFLTTLGITSVLVAAQVIGLPNQKLKVAQAHCKVYHPHHCKIQDLDPTPSIPGSKKVAEEAWGEGGRGMYSAAAEFMSRDNSHIPRQSLDSRQKELLRPEFGSLVDMVTVQYGADMMDRWGSGSFQISQGSDGQTFCNRIYIQAPHRQNDYGQLLLLAHELQHSRQCENLGGMSNFGYRYFKEFKKAGQSYANNSLEREAETVANRVKQYVDSQPNVASQSQGTPSPPSDSLPLSQLPPGSDKGYGNLPRAFVDVNGDGRTDYCRFVGDAPNAFIACILRTSDGSWGGQYDYKSIIGIDQGYSDRPRGFKDANGDGRADYCRFVGDAPKIFESCNLSTPSGFDSNQYTLNIGL